VEPANQHKPDDAAPCASKGPSRADINRLSSGQAGSRNLSRTVFILRLRSRPKAVRATGSEDSTGAWSSFEGGMGRLSTCRFFTRWDEMKGKISWFSPEWAYGFIEAEDGTSVFVHLNQVTESPNGEPPGVPMKGGDEVSFELAEGKSGKFHADTVRILNARPIVEGAEPPAPRNKLGIARLAGSKLPREALEGRDDFRWEK
jgi:cold shock CspA family protein